MLTVALKPAPARGLGADLSARFAAVCREVAVAPIPSDSLHDDSDQAYGDRVFLRHYCVHLSGADPAHEWPAFPADVRAARGFNGDLALHADRWRAALGEGTDPRRLGRALARKTLLAIAGLVSIHDRTWTTDRTTAARRWAELHPELASDLDVLLAWSESRAHTDDATIQRALNGIITPTVSAFSTQIGLWTQRVARWSGPDTGGLSSGECW